MTPAEIQALRGPFAQVVGSLLGFSPSAIMQSAAVRPAQGSTPFPSFAGGFASGGAPSGSAPQGVPWTWWNPGLVVGLQRLDGPSPGTGGLSGLGGAGGAGGAPVLGTGGDGPLGNDVLAGIPKWGGPFVAGMSPGESAMLSVLREHAAGNRTPLLEQILGGHFLPGRAGENPFLQAAIEAAQRPTLQRLEETLSRTLPGRFTQGGQFVQPQGTSAFDRAAALAARDAQTTMADIASRMSFQGYESERGRQMEAIKLSQTEVDTLIKNLQAQALPRLIEDMGIQRGLQEFQNRINALLQTLGVLTGAPMISLGQAGQSQSSSSQFSLGLGGLGGG